MEILFSFDWGIRVEKTLNANSPFRQFLSTTLISFDLGFTLVLHILSNIYATITTHYIIQKMIVYECNGKDIFMR
jgi:hypothetical protein